MRTFDTDLLIARLCVENPRPKGQDRRERALDILTLLVQHIDDAQEAEAKARADAAAQHVGFYTFAFVDDSHRDTFDVPQPELESFARVHRVDKNKLIDIAEGRIADYHGWRNGPNMVSALNRPFKPAPRTSPDELQILRAKEHKAHLKALEEYRKLTKPIPQTTHTQFSSREK